MKQAGERGVLQLSINYELQMLLGRVLCPSVAHELRPMPPTSTMMNSRRPLPMRSLKSGTAAPMTLPLHALPLSHFTLHAAACHYLTLPLPSCCHHDVELLRDSHE
ncbi:hypothetical protein GUJ93_ZPchr0613g6588 [Zizania palustris]|uniref:Uncharacterized protein n=1 Tax=Zizania palustris TaxID=103762 RepID=A0A8J5VDI5_ZIZPA|nr:hypothetical protein GUJ93_ZPchr0613g6588 [Zizania palustris]